MIDKRSRDEIEEEALADAVDRVQDERLAAELGPIFRAHGHGMVDRFGEDERQRVAALVERDREEARKDRLRRAAEIEVADGVFVNLGDTVVEPTPEWMEKGDFRVFRPMQPNGTVREIATVRRVSTSVVDRLHQHGKMTDDQAAACRWYHMTWTSAGLEGRCASSQWNPTSTIRRGAVDAGFGYVPTAAAIADARDSFRMARQVIPSHRLQFFDAVTLADTPLRHARRLTKVRNGEETALLRDLAESVFVLCEHHGFHMPGTGDLTGDQK